MTAWSAKVWTSSICAVGERHRLVARRARKRRSTSPSRNSGTPSTARERRRCLSLGICVVGIVRARRECARRVLARRAAARPTCREPGRADALARYARSFGDCRCMRRGDEARRPRAAQIMPPLARRRAAPRMSTSVSSTASRSNAERLMTFSTSAVAVCCCSASVEVARARLHLVEQAHVLDRDHGLVGEGLHELDLALGERRRLARGDDEYADDLVRRASAARQSRRESRPTRGCSPLLSDRRPDRRAGRRMLLHLAGQHHALGSRAAGPRGSGGPRAGGRRLRRAAPAIALRLEDVAFAQMRMAPRLRVAKSHGRLDQRLEHRVQIERRAADDLQHVGGRGLLLQRLGRDRASAPAPRRTAARSRSRSRPGRRRSARARSGVRVNGARLAAAQGERRRSLRRRAAAARRAWRDIAADVDGAPLTR